MNLADDDIDLALAAIEASKPDDGNGGAPAVMADCDPHQPDIRISDLIEELIAFAKGSNSNIGSWAHSLT